MIPLVLAWDVGDESTVLGDDHTENNLYGFQLGTDVPPFDPPYILVDSGGLFYHGAAVGLTVSW